MMLARTGGPYEAGRATPTRWRFNILGPLQIFRDGQPVDPGPRKRQIVLAALLCHTNSAVPVDSLISALWDDHPPRTAHKNLQGYVSALRGLFHGRGSALCISNELGGYVLRASEDELDSLEFAQRAAAAQAVWDDDDLASASVTLADALGLWRGDVLAGLRSVPILDAAARRLEHRLLNTFEYWAEAEVGRGMAARVIDRITNVAIEHPFRERLRMAQMRALCQTGRRSEALAVYDELRQSLAREFGLSPSGALARFYQCLLSEDDTVLALRVAAPLHR